MFLLYALCAEVGCWFFESVNRLVHHLRVPFSGWSDPSCLWCDAKRMALSIQMVKN